MKRKSLKELEDIAAQATRQALAQYVIDDVLWNQLALGIRFDGDYRIFELYIPGSRPEDAKLISEARVHSIDGSVSIEVYGLERKAVQGDASSI